MSEKPIKTQSILPRIDGIQADVTPEEIYKILNENLEDFEKYLAMIKKVVENPEEFGLSVE